EEWADFAREVVGKKEKAAMQSHLENGCKECSKTLTVWRRVRDTARRERIYEPPESAVRSIKRTFAIRGPQKAGPASRTVASLLFDSLLNPLPAGVRSTGSAARQMLFGLAEYRIDVRMEPLMDSDKVAVVGQVLSSSDPGNRIGEVPVRLMRGAKVVAECTTSAFGEFQLECNLEGAFQLRVKLPSEELYLPLVEPAVAAGLESMEYKDIKRLKKISGLRKKRTRKKV
ncbi:MAG: hypothetical protein WBX12_09940, partial [Candidatus Acidiferrales bacterium]